MRKAKFNRSYGESYGIIRKVCSDDETKREGGEKNYVTALSEAPDRVFSKISTVTVDIKMFFLSLDFPSLK